MLNTQKMICEAFDYKSPFATNIFAINEKQAATIELVDNNTEACSMCGHIHNVGYKSKISAESLLKTLVSDTYNECYAFRISNFICEYCGYSLKAYGSPSKSQFGKKMVNVLVHNGKALEKSFNSDEKNELYNILVNPPKPPFVIMINSRGTVLENLVFSSKATISRGLIVVNYGLNNLEVSPDEVFNSIEDAKNIAKKFGIELNSDSIWNRADDVSIWVKRNGKYGSIDLLSFYNDMGIFIDKYNRDCRLVAKMVLNAYLKSHVNKESKKGESVNTESNNTNKNSLFDF